MSKDDFGLLPGQANKEMPQENEPFYLPPIHYLVAAYLCNGKLSTVKQVNEFVSRNSEFSDSLQEIISGLIDSGALVVEDDGTLWADKQNSRWHDFDDSKMWERLVPDLCKIISERAVIDRQKNTSDLMSFSAVLDFPETKEVKAALEVEISRFYENLTKLQDEIAKKGINSDKVRGFVISSGILVEEDFC